MDSSNSRTTEVAVSLCLTLGADGGQLHLTSTSLRDRRKAAAALLRIASKWLGLSGPAAPAPVAAAAAAPAPLPPVARSAPPPIFPILLPKDEIFLKPLPLSSSALGRLTREEREYTASLSPDEYRELVRCAEEMKADDGARQRSSAPLRCRVTTSRMPLDLKSRINAKLEKLADSGGSSELAKYSAWVETCLSIPFGVLRLPSTECSGGGGMEAQLARCRAHLDSVVYGHAGAKQAIIERLFAWMSNPHVPQRPLAFWGTPGNGKTTLAKLGLGPLFDRPVCFVSLGGAHDCSTLVGHGYTFEASQSGRIVECLASSTCMNPVIYFDELDKVSDTPKGEEIVNTLVHLTDSSQNDVFRDRYLNGVDLDLSKALLVFSFNDITKVPPVLQERMQVVKMEPFTREAQRSVVTGFLLPKALRSAGGEGSFELSPGAMDELLDSVDSSSGLRGALDVLTQIIIKVLIWEKTQSAKLICPLQPAHFSDRTILRGAVRSICSDPSFVQRHGAARDVSVAMMYV